METQTLAATQLQADTQTAERLTAEKRRAAERISELEGEASTAAAAHQKAVQQLQDELQAAQRQLQTAEGARRDAEERVQLLDTVLKELVDERAQHERALREAHEQTATEREQAETLRCSLREAKATLRQQRDQLDRTALSLTAARAAIDLRVNQAQLEKMKEELRAAQKELATRTEERDLAQELAKGLLSLHEKQNQKLTSLEGELSKQKTLAAERQSVLAELTGKMNKVYDQLILIKTKKDWRV